MKEQLFIGVDIGISGGITGVNAKGDIVFCMVMPVMEIIVNKKKKNQYDLGAIDTLVSGLVKKWDCSAILERLRPIPMQSSQTGFSLGYGTAVFESLFTAHGIPFEHEEPRSWQKVMFAGYNYTSEQTKIVSAQVARKLAPKEPFLETPRCKKMHDGMTDSFCMAVYLLREYFRYAKSTRC